MSASGFSLFQRAELLYEQGKVEDAFVHYQKSIKEILRDEIPTKAVPVRAFRPLRDDDPREMLGMVWRNFVGFFRDPAMTLTPESHPEAFKLLNAFSPKSGSGSKMHARLQRTDRGKLLLKAMQITAGLTLGLLAWDKCDRATASKRYKEALDLATSNQLPLTVLQPGVVGLEKYVYVELQQAWDNFGLLVLNDAIHDNMMTATAAGDGGLSQRKDVLELPVPDLRIDKTGRPTFQKSVIVATDACGKCGKRDVKLMRCAMCKKMPYCSVECQKADWKTHKITTCIKKT